MGDAAADLTADTLSLTANDGIGIGNSIETAAGAITARTIDPAALWANIVISNDNTAPTSLTASTVGIGSWIQFNQTSGGELTLTDVSTADGHVNISADSGNIVAAMVDAGGPYNITLGTTTSGDVIVDDVKALGNKITINSDGSIKENPDAGIDLTATDLELHAVTGIGATDAIETDVASLEAHSTTGDIVIVEKDDVALKNILAHAGNIFLEATDGGTTYDSGTIKAGSSTLTMIQSSDLDISIFDFDNQTNTDLMLQSTSGSVTADTTTADNAADQWKSIQAKAAGNITLQGSDAGRDVVIGTGTGINPGGGHTFDGVVTSTGGGVLIISDNSGIYDSTSGITLDNVAITGYSDGTRGVDLPTGFGKKAAIVIISKEDLKLAENCTLTANGEYNPTVDERQDVLFFEDGDAIDVAIYLGSTQEIADEGNIELGSGVVSIDNTTGVGTLVVDAYDTVTFTSAFENSLKQNGSSDVKRIEVVSRYSQDMAMARGADQGYMLRLPHADDLRSLAGGEFVLYGGVYALRGTKDGKLLSLAEILALVGPVPLIPPIPLEPENRGEVEEADTEALMQWLVEELGETAAQVYLARAYPPSLNTDLRHPYKEVERLRNFAAILKDPGGTHIAALGRVVNEFVPPSVPPSEEQMASIAEVFELHSNDGTHYATAGQWLDALAEYVAILNTKIGWPADKSIAFVMGKYRTAITEASDVSVVAFIQMHLEGLGG
jgi:hypothetical protein